jgi:hypothetical protein
MNDIPVMLAFAVSAAVIVIALVGFFIWAF